MAIILKFLGAAQNVTGSSYLLEANGQRLLVDCGLYQERDLVARNWAPFPVAPNTISGVLLTHAHLDHCGLLPKLAKDGFRGPVYGTSATLDLAKIILLDSAKIQEEDAANKKERHEKEGRQGPFPIRPLYTIADVESLLSQFKPIEYNTTLDVNPNCSAVYYDAGHILGSSLINVQLRQNGTTRSVLFTGDIGRGNMPILRDPVSGESTDYVVMESTYGDRLHADTADIPGELARVIHDTVERGGKIIMPCFAVERSQEVLFHLHNLLKDQRIPNLPVFLDSPMANKITLAFNRHMDLFDAATTARIQNGEHPYDFAGLQLTNTVDDSKKINKFKHPAIIIAGSGMCTGGRIKHHLTHTITQSANTVVFVGYQAVGTLGRLILDGVNPIRILGQQYKVRARIAQIHGFSAHADRDELLTWLKGLDHPPRRVFVTHGEAETARSFASYIQAQTGYAAEAPAFSESIELA